MNDQHEQTNERAATFARLDQLARCHAVVRALERVTPVLVREVLTKIPAVALRRALASVISPDGKIYPSKADYDAARKDAAEL